MWDFLDEVSDSIAASVKEGAFYIAETLHIDAIFAVAFLIIFICTLIYFGVFGTVIVFLVKKGLLILWKTTKKTAKGTVKAGVKAGGALAKEAGSSMTDGAEEK